MSTTTTTALTNINIMSDILDGSVHPAKIFVTYSQIIQDSDPTVPDIRSATTHEINSSSDITKESAIVQDIYNVVFNSPRMPDPIIKID